MIRFWILKLSLSGFGFEKPKSVHLCLDSLLCGSSCCFLLLCVSPLAGKLPKKQITFTVWVFAYSRSLCIHKFTWNCYYAECLLITGRRCANGVKTPLLRRPLLGPVGYIRAHNLFAIAVRITFIFMYWGRQW